MNIKEVTKIFDEEILEALCEISTNRETYAYLKMENGGVCAEIFLDEDFKLYIYTEDVEWINVNGKMVELIYKIKTQWENYTSQKNNYKSAFNELMEADEIFDTLDRMCEVTE
jgi:hypothetical protein